MTAPARVRLPSALVALFPGASPVVDLPGDTVAALVDGLDARWPGMRDRLCDGRPSLRRHINVFIDGERCTLASRVAPGADVYILTAISGG